MYSSAEFRPHHSRLLVALVIIVAVAIAGIIKPVPAFAADAGCASFPAAFAVSDQDGVNIRVGCARDAGALRSYASSDADLVIAVDITLKSDRPDLARQIVADTAASIRADMNGRTLGQALQFRSEREAAGLAETLAGPDFGGRVEAVGDTLVLVIPQSDIGTAGWWDGFWKIVIARVAGFAAGALGTALCLLTFAVGAPLAAPVCGAVGGAIDGVIVELVAAALNGQPIDATKTGTLFGQAVIGAVLGVAGGTAAKVLSDIGGNFVIKAQVFLRTLGATFGNWTSSLEATARMLGDPAFLRSILEQARRFGATSASAPALTVLPLGDSITNGVGSSDGSGYLKHLLELGGSGVRLVGSQRSGPDALPNEGRGGWMISDIAGIADATIAAYRPDVVLLHLGTNDMDRGDAAGAPARLGALIDQIFRASPNVTIVVSQIVPAANPTTAARIKAFNAQIAELVYARGGMKLFMTNMGAVRTANMPDGLHPNNRGYQKMAMSFYNGLLTTKEAGWVTSGSGGGGPTFQYCPRGGWIGRGEIAAGSPAGGGGVKFGDLNGDGRDDYLVVGAQGATDAWLNTGAGITPGSGWTALGRVATGAGSDLAGVFFADIDGDRRDDYLAMRSSGAIDAWRNSSADTDGAGGWTYLGQIASGTGAVVTQVRFADIDGDGRDDYIWVHENGSADAWINKGGSGGTYLWDPRPQIAAGANTPAVMFAKVNCDARDDYLVYDQRTGEVRAFENTGGDTSSAPGWVSRGQIASGAPGVPQSILHFADLDGDGQDDYLLVSRDTGAVRAWTNEGGDA